jgi:hypothetical protein
MKPLMQIVLILVTFSMVASSPISAQDPTEQSLDDKEFDQLQTDLRAKQEALNLLTARRLHSLPGTVLMIPTADMKAEDLATLTQDLNIMARILDKKLDRGHFLDMLQLDASAHWALYDTFFSGNNGPTKAVYVHGYGAVFLLNVDFPLAPAAEVKVEKPEEPIDPLWEQTKQQLQSDTQAPGPLGRAWTYYDKWVTAAASYDPDKVEGLKRKLISALKHAANIRSLNADECVILSVTGAPQPVVVKEVSSEKGPLWVTPNVPGLPPASSMVMTIRVKKSDIDLFAKDELDTDQFRQKTQILTYPHVSGQAGSAMIY